MSYITVKNRVARIGLSALLSFLLLGLISGCSEFEDNNNSGKATLHISLPFSKSTSSYSRSIASKGGFLPNEITTVSFRLLDSNNYEVSRAIMTEDNNQHSFRVQSGVSYKIIGSAYANEELLYEGESIVPPLDLGELRNVSLSLNSKINIAINLQTPEGRLKISKGQVYSFSATVEGLENPKLHYYVNDVEGGDESIGIIDENGLYTPPENIDPTQGAVVLKVVPEVAPSFTQEIILSFDATPQTLQAPAELLAEANDAYIVLTWSVVEDATVYNIYRNTVSANNSEQTPLVENHSGTEYIDTEASPEVTYYYTVVARNESTSSPNSIEKSATLISSQAEPLPAPATGLIATATEGKVELSWSHADPSLHFEIYRSTISGAFTNVDPLDEQTGITTYSDTGVTNGTKYYYFVLARNSSGVSGPSNEIEATPLSPVPVSPTALSAQAGDAEIQLAWSHVDPSSTFEIYRSTQAGAFTNVDPLTSLIGATTYIDSDVTNGIKYFYYILAINSSGLSDPSNEVEATPASSVPAAPALQVVEVGENIIQLIWQHNDPSLEIELYRSTQENVAIAGDPLVLINTATNLYTDTAVVNDTTYYYIAIAKNGSIRSVASNEVSATPVSSVTLKTLQILSPPELLVVGNNVQLAVNGGYSDDTDVDITDLVTWTIEQSSLFAEISTAPDETGKLNALAAGDITITASYQSISSASISLTLVDLTPPVGLKTTLLQGAINLEWEPVTTIASPIYNLFISTTLPVENGDGSATNGLNHTFDSLDASVTYYIGVRTGIVYNGKTYYGQVGEPIIASLPALPESPLQPVLTDQVSMIEVGGYEVANVDSYLIYRSNDDFGSSIFTLIDSTAEPIYHDLTILPGRTYSYQVKARNLGGESDPSPVASILLPPSAPSDESIVVTSSKNGLHISWDPTFGATGYNVYLGTADGVAPPPRGSDTGNFDVSQLNIQNNYIEFPADAYFVNNQIYFVVMTATNASGDSWDFGSSFGAIGLSDEKLSAAQSHTCFIDKNSKLFCHGANYDNQLAIEINEPVVIPMEVNTSTRWRSVSAGGAIQGSDFVTYDHGHTCAIRVDNTLWCWGRNDKGQLGSDSLEITRFSPAQESSNSNDWSMVSSGFLHTCGIKTDNTLWCWGNNYDGQLGINKTRIELIDTSVPTQVFSNPTEPALSVNWLHVSAGLQHTCAIDTNHALHCWGANPTYGPLLGTDSPNANEIAPYFVDDLIWLTVSAGRNHSCGIIQNDPASQTLRCWGINSTGQLGLGDDFDAIYPTNIASIDINQNPLPTQWKTVNVYDSNSCAIDINNKLWCWGSNNNFQLGDATNFDAFLPTAVATPDADWSNVAQGVFHTCASKADDSNWCWGGNADGQLGIGDIADAKTPRQEATKAIDWIQVDVSRNHVCAVKDDATAYCWGWNYIGQLGNDSYVSTNQATEIGIPQYSNGVNWKKISVGPSNIEGDDHSCGLTTSGRIYCWGDNRDGQVGTGASDLWDYSLPESEAQGFSNWVDVEVGVEYSCGIQEDLGGNRKLWCWGSESGGKLGNGSYTSNQFAPEQESSLRNDWDKVSLGGFSCGITTGEALFCWGQNTYGMGFNDPSVFQVTTPRELISVSDGNVISASPLWREISVGNNSACAIDENTNLYCWGYNLQKAETSDVSEIDIPILVSSGWLKVSVSSYSGDVSHICAIKTDNTLWCFGSNYLDGLGNPTAIDISKHHNFVQVEPTISDWKNVFVGGANNCAQRSDNSLYCWGDNRFGQLGDGLSWKSVPTIIP